jgi:prepilin-type N-terminal cleavage/methylation domain-containing protein
MAAGEKMTDFRGLFRCRCAFTLIEVLLVISIIALLLSIMVPVLSVSRAKSRAVVCGSNIRQLVLANNSYAGNNKGIFAPGALDIFSSNLCRWYGVRSRTDEPFDNKKGPLANYLAEGMLNCPEKIRYQTLEPDDEEYDAGSGGYGYNMTYIGSRIWMDGYEDTSCKVSAKQEQITRPSRTLMFADTAMGKAGGYLIEYSFAEPRYFLVAGEPDMTWDPDPSIHFRHRRKATIAWSDAHTSYEKMGKYDGFNEDGLQPSTMNLGWFEPMDNSMFDLK